MSKSIQQDINKLIELYFAQPKVLYEHLFGSYHQFVGEIIPYHLTQENSTFYENVVKNVIYRHGFKFNNIRIKPSTWDNDNEIKFPSDCRKNHLNYFSTVLADVQQYTERIDSITGERTEKMIGDLEKEVQIANIPIMVKSKYCSTHIKQDLKGECKYDPGGYFIVGGKEKIIMSMENIVNNKVLVFTKKDTTYADGIYYTAQINSKKNDWSDNLQILTIKNRKDGVITITTSSQLVDIPLFILMRALGVESDMDIISHISYNLEDVSMLNLLRPSVIASTDEAEVPIKTREEAIEYLITKLKRNRNISQTDEKLAIIQKKMYLEKILRQDLLPHLGEDIPKKIAFLGYMTNRLLNVMLGRLKQDDRDALHNKRIEPPGILLGLLFSQNKKKMLNEIGKNFTKKNQSDDNPINVVSQIKPSVIEQGIKTALATGIWGMNKTKKGVAQSLQRLSWIQGISYLRRVMAPSLEDATAKVTSIRMINNNQINLLDPVESPEGQKIGIAKALSMTATITLQNTSQADVVKMILRKNKAVKHPYDIDPLTMNQMIKIMVNGDWVGVCKLSEGNNIYTHLKNQRKQNIIDKFTSILFDFKNREIRILYEGGRLIRPLLIVTDGKVNITKEVSKEINDEIEEKDRTRSWKKLLTKYPNLIEYEDVESLNYLLIADTQDRLKENEENKQRKVEYKESTKINRYGDYRYMNYTHSDLHSWLLFGTVAGNIPFSNHNANKGNVIHFAQAKQSISIYLSSYKDRMDISQILYHPQVPICQTEAMKYNGCLDLPFGENAIVAIASYTGLTFSPSWYGLCPTVFSFEKQY